MSRGDSVSRMHGTLKGRCEVRLLENRYAPIAYKCIVKMIMVITGHWLHLRGWERGRFLNR